MYPSVTLIHPPVNICYPRLNTVYPLFILMYPSVTLIHPTVNICYPRLNTVYPLLIFRHVEVERVLFPMLVRMEFDTKERYKFFCLARQRACGIGSGPRQGHSALRECTPHASRVDMPAKRRAAADPQSENGEDAAASVSRRGLHPHRECTALVHLEHCVIRWPNRLYFGLHAYDCMHTLFINCIGYLIEALLSTMTATNKIELDRRVRSFTSFRRPDGVATRRITKLSSLAYTTAETKVTHLFVWSHALGSKGLLLRPEIRDDALVALTTLQTICYSVRGLRPYTQEEWNYIFRRLGKLFFRSLSNISHCTRSKKIQKAEAFNVDKPPSKRRRVPHWKTAEKLQESTTDTASSSDDDMPPYFVRSAKIVPHSFLHLTDQVCLGGSHRFHDTCSVESAHPWCLGLAGSRSRTYSDLNRSSRGMFDFLNNMRLLQEICVQAKADGTYTLARSRTT